MWKRALCAALAITGADGLFQMLACGEQTHRNKMRLGQPQSEPLGQDPDRQWFAPRSEFCFVSSFAASRSARTKWYIHRPQRTGKSCVISLSCWRKISGSAVCLAHPPEPRTPW